MRVKLAGALIATLLVFGMVFGAGHAAAASLPGEPLYGLKLAAEQARMELTTNPETRAQLAADLAENRLGEIAQMVASGQEVDRDTAVAALHQLSRAYQASRQISGDDEEKQLQAQERFAWMLMNQQGVLATNVEASSQQQEQVRALMSSMVRVRAQLQTAQGTEAETGRQYPDVSDPASQSGAGMQAGQQDGDGLLDGTGPQYDSNANGQGLGPAFNYGPQEEDMGSFQGDDPNGLKPAAPPNDTGEDQGPFGWLWRLLTGDPDSGSGSSGSGSSGSNSSGSNSSGSNSSGSGSSGNDSSGSGGSQGGRR